MAGDKQVTLRQAMVSQIPFLRRRPKASDERLARLAVTIADLWDDYDFLCSYRVIDECQSMGMVLPEAAKDFDRQISLHLDAVSRQGLPSWMSESYVPLSDLLGLEPGELLCGEVFVPEDPSSRARLAEALVARAAEVMPEPGLRGDGELVFLGGPVGWMRAAIIEARLRQLCGRASKLDARIVVVSPEVSAEFIQRHHSALKERNYRGALYDLGLEVGGRLVAVMTVTAPSGPHRDPHRVVEVSRVASDGTLHGASSTLVKKAMELVDLSRRYGEMRPGLLVTYSLLSEYGTTYKSLESFGLRPTQFLAGRPEQSDGSSRPSFASKSGVPKIRWEYGAEAAPADKSLLRLVRPYVKFMEGRALERSDLKDLNLERLFDLVKALTGKRPRSGDRAKLMDLLTSLRSTP